MPSSFDIPVNDRIIKCFLDFLLFYGFTKWNLNKQQNALCISSWYRRNVQIWNGSGIQRVTPLTGLRCRSSIVHCLCSSIRTLKSAIEQEHGISPSKQILIISGGELLDDDAVQVCMKTRDTGAGTVGEYSLDHVFASWNWFRRRIRSICWTKPIWNDQDQFNCHWQRTVFQCWMMQRWNNGSPCHRPTKRLFNELILHRCVRLVAEYRTAILFSSLLFPFDRISMATLRN